MSGCSIHLARSGTVLLVSGSAAETAVAKSLLDGLLAMYRVERLTVSTEFINLLLGRQGATLQRIEAETGTRIDVDRNTGEVVVRAQRVAAAASRNEGGRGRSSSSSYGGGLKRPEERPEEEEGGGEWLQASPSGRRRPVVHAAAAGPDFESAVAAIRAAVEVSIDDGGGEKSHARHAVMSVVLPADRKAHVVGVGNSRLRTLEQKYDVQIDFDSRHAAAVKSLSLIPNP